MTGLWYHDFEVLGVTEQKPGPYKRNQLAKQKFIFSLIDEAISLCLEDQKSATGVELFCADGFYANYSAKKHRAKVRGIDLSAGYLKQAERITQLLGNEERVTFTHCDVMDLHVEYDFAICAGGLYHLSEPEALLRLLREKIRVALVIQTVVSLANTEEDYFETPAPGRKAGCRFSYGYLLGMVNSVGWEICEQHFNELEGNVRIHDRGSAYLLCT